MKATNQLKAEHEGIGVMLRVLEAVSRRLESGEAVDTDHLAKMIEFFRVFVDRCHHGKEEHMLFPALEQVGVPREGGPIGQMLAEHDAGRGHIRGMAEALDRYKTDPAAGAVFASHARKYSELLRDHIQKENSILFEIADIKLGTDAQGDLFDAFEKLETEQIGVGKHEEFHKLLDKLAGIYLN